MVDNVVVDLEESGSLSSGVLFKYWAILERFLVEMFLSGLPIDRMGLYMSGKKHNLQDAKSLSDYGLLDASVIDVVIRPAVTQSRSSGSNKLKIRVVTSCLYLQVNPTDKVQVN